MAESTDEEPRRVQDTNENDADDESDAVPENVFIQRLRRSEKDWSLYGSYYVCCNGGIFIGPIRSWWWLLELLTILVTATFIVE